MQYLKFFYSRCILKYRLAAMLMLLTIAGFTQDVMIQGWWWNYPPTVGFQHWGANFQKYVPDLSEAGFTYIWLPPLSRPSTYPSTGYDIKDYYDLGGGRLGATDFGTRAEVAALITLLKKNGIHPVADMIYNQRTGGAWENNPAVQGWITNFNQSSVSNGDNPYPSDRVRCILPIGGTTGIDTGNLYFKIRSASLNATYQCLPYTFQISSNRKPVARDSVKDQWEYEPNGGANCGDSNNTYIFTYNKYAKVDGPGCYGENCGIDEFKLTLDTSMYYAAGDTLYITMTNDNATGTAGFSDHYLYDLWDGAADSSIVSRIVYQTQTDFTHMPSGRGAMTWRNFKPNGNATTLNGDWDSMLFFYDIDQFVASTVSTIAAYQEWMFDSIGIEGMRVDAVKNYTPQFAAEMLDSLHFHGHNPQMVVGEYYDGYAPNLINYINTVQGEVAPTTADSIHMKLFDFALRFPLQDACNLNSDVRNLFTSGIVDGGGGNKVNAVTWVNNHDFRAAGQAITANPELAYAYIISNPFIGTPCIYFADYHNSNRLKGLIKGIMHASKAYTFNADHVDYLNKIGSSYNAYFTPGAHGYTQNTIITQYHNPVTNKVAIVAINFSYDTLDVYQQINTTYAAAGDTFSDVFGINAIPITTITGNNEIHVTIPPRTFTMFVQGTIDSLISMGDTFNIAGSGSGIVQVETKKQSSISVFPNPFKQNINLQLKDVEGDNLLVNLYDISGRLVYTDKLSNPGSGVVRFTTPVTSSGIYLLKVTANNQSRFFKLARN